MPEPLSEEKLAELEGLESKATRSPWSAFDPEGVECGRLCTPDGCQGHASGMFELDGPPRADDWPDTHLFTCEADAKLIAEARNALPSLLAEVRLGREALKTLEDLYAEDIAGRASDCATDAERAALAILRKAGRR